MGIPNCHQECISIFCLKIPIIILFYTAMLPTKMNQLSYIFFFKLKILTNQLCVGIPGLRPDRQVQRVWVRSLGRMQGHIFWLLGWPDLLYGRQGQGELWHLLCWTLHRACSPHTWHSAIDIQHTDITHQSQISAIFIYFISHPILD